MIKAKVLGLVKPGTVVCLSGKNDLFFVEDFQCTTENNEPIGDIVWFDEWFWTGDIRQLKTILQEHKCT